jgi:hypothetical protein
MAYIGKNSFTLGSPTGAPDGTKFLRDDWTWVVPTDTDTNTDTKWDGGTTGLTAATGRTSLGLVIGTDVQAYDADLATVASSGIGTSANQMVRLDGSAALPAVSGANLTNLPIQIEEDYWSFDMSSATGTTVHSITASFTPKFAWMTYNDNAQNIGMVTGWMNVSGNTAGSQNAGNIAAGYYAQGNGIFQCGASGGRQHIEITASASGQYTISNTPNGSPSGTGYFSLILFGN